MPTYTYHCPECNELFDRRDSIAQHKSIQHCPKCYALSTQVPVKSEFILEGHGWARDGYILKGTKANN